jgi:ABC-type transport system involved in multi-copper enzyme maturation permease subunit
MLSKPIARGSIIFGKFIGFTLVVGLIVAIETALLIGICLSQGVMIDTVFLISIACIAIKLLSLLSLILLFSTFVSTGLAIFMTIASAIIGHGGYTMLDYAIRHQDSIYAVLARTILVAFPNLESLNLKSLVGTSATIDLTSYMIAMLLGLIYTFVILMLAAHTFQKKSFDTV